MTMAMSSPYPAPAESGKAATKGKPSAADRDVTATAGGGFEAILSSLEQNLEPSAADNGPAQSDASVDVDPQPDPGLLLANMGLTVPASDAVTDIGALNADALEAVAPDNVSKAVLSAERPQTKGLGELGDRSKAALTDVFKGALADTELPNVGTSTESNVSGGQKAHKAKGISEVLEDARGKVKGIQTEQIQNKSDVAVNLDLLKGATADIAKRPQELLLGKSLVVENAGGVLHSQNQPTASYQSFDALLGSMPSTDSVSGQPVNYWISADVQNAEMKLDGLGKGPVEVSISVHGKEADVTFRTDEIQTRELLESSTGSLKDLMSREGMVLTGMTVGTNGSGSSNPNGKGGGKHQHTGRPMIGTVTPVVHVESGGNTTGMIGKTLNLFV